MVDGRRRALRTLGRRRLHGPGGGRPIPYVGRRRHLQARWPGACDGDGLGGGGRSERGLRRCRGRRRSLCGRGLRPVPFGIATIAPAEKVGDVSGYMHLSSVIQTNARPPSPAAARRAEYGPDYTPAEISPLDQADKGFPMGPSSDLVTCQGRKKGNSVVSQVRNHRSRESARSFMASVSTLGKNGILVRIPVTGALLRGPAAISTLRRQLIIEPAPSRQKEGEA